MRQTADPQELSSSVVPADQTQAGRIGPAFHAHKQEMLNSFVDFTYGGPMPRWPLEIFLEISNVCDLKCAMCPTFSAINPKRFSNLKQVDRGILAIEDATEPLEELLSHALIVHAFGYGEPTIHPNFREFIDYLSQFEVMIDFFSHGQHLDQQMCEFLVDRRVNRITISFSGANASDYESIYMGGKFQTVLDGLERLNRVKLAAKSSFPEVHVNSIAFNHHVENLVEFVHMMGKRGISQVNLKPLATYDSIPELHAHTSVLRRQIEGKILSAAKATAQGYGLAIESSAYEHMSTEESDVWKTLEQRHRGGRKLSRTVVDISTFKGLAKTRKKAPISDRANAEADPPRCEASRLMTNRGTPCFEPLTTFYASFDGKVYPCCFKQNDSLPLGSLKTHSGVDIWEGHDFIAMRENAMDNKYRVDICRPCLRSKAYPKHHAIPGKIGRYVRWFREGFEVPFDRVTLRRCRELPDNEGILRRRARCHNEYNSFLETLSHHGIPLSGLSPETSMSDLLQSYPREMVSALRSFHANALRLHLGEARRLRMLRILPALSRSSLALILSVIFIIGCVNSFLRFETLAYVELSMIAVVVGNQAIRVLMTRKLMAKKHPESVSIDRFLEALEG